MEYDKRNSGNITSSPSIYNFKRADTIVALGDILSDVTSSNVVVRPKVPVESNETVGGNTSKFNVLLYIARNE